MSILVIGGSQGARILSEVVPPSIAMLPDEIKSHLRVSHQARGEDHANVAAFYAEQGITADVQEFFTDIPERMSEAQLVISRAGASSVADISVIGRPSILIPLAIATGDHQSANARGLEEADGAVVIPETAFNVETLTAQITAILSDADAAVEMSAGALAMGMPDATANLVAMVHGLAQEDV